MFLSNHPLPPPRTCDGGGESYTREDIHVVTLGWVQGARTIGHLVRGKGTARCHHRAAYRRHIQFQPVGFQTNIAMVRTFLMFKNITNHELN